MSVVWLGYFCDYRLIEFFYTSMVERESLHTLCALCILHFVRSIIAIGILQKERERGGRHANINLIIIFKLEYYSKERERNKKHMIVN